MSSSNVQNLQMKPKLKSLYQYLNKTLQLLLSIFLLYPSCLPSCLDSLHFFLSTFISNFFNYYINRQLMFLLCNCILVFVTSGAGCISSSMSDLPHESYYERSEEHQQLAPLEVKEAVGDDKRMMEIVEPSVHVVQEAAAAIEEEEEDVKEDEDDGDDVEYGALVTMASDEKIEHFIKMMKERMRMEAQMLLLTAK